MKAASALLASAASNLVKKLLLGIKIATLIYVGGGANLQDVSAMPNRADDPLRKVTLNLYEADCAWFEREYGRGWSKRLRQHIHNEVLARTQPSFNIARPKLPTARTLGDLADDQ